MLEELSVAPRVDWLSTSFSVGVSSVVNLKAEVPVESVASVTATTVKSVVSVSPYLLFLSVSTSSLVVTVYRSAPSTSPSAGVSVLTPYLVVMVKTESRDEA